MNKPLDVLDASLLPCPWCGGEAKIIGAGEEYEGLVFLIHCGRCPATMDFDSVLPELEAIAAWNRRAPQPATGVPLPEWERNFPPEWDRHPWANWACLVATTGALTGIEFMWYYFEQKPEWGGKSYNWVDGQWGFANPVTKAPLRAFFDTKDTLRQRGERGDK